MGRISFDSTAVAGEFNSAELEDLVERVGFESLLLFGGTLGSLGRSFSSSSIGMSELKHSDYKLLKQLTKQIMVQK